MHEVVNSGANAYDHTVGGATMYKWGLDEAYATKKLISYPDRSIFAFIKRDQARLDRSVWEYTDGQFAADVYADSHSIRPYLDHKEEIDKVVDLILRSGISRVHSFGTTVRKYA